jgi:hypothetical protein
MIRVERCEPHCVGWVQATASLWGMASDHHLDEPVRLSVETPVRLRVVDPHCVTADRELSLKAERAGTHIALRFYFRDGSYHEVDLIGVPHLNMGETAHVDVDQVLYR